MSKRFYITTAIDYTNGQPHLGHAYEKIIADVIARARRSLGQETFLTEKDRRPDGTFDPAYGDVVELEEENYYFKLKDHQQWLIDYLEENPSFVEPEIHRNWVLGFLKSSVLEDLCTTRPASRL